MQRLGEGAAEGFTHEDLVRIVEFLDSLGYRDMCELIDLGSWRRLDRRVFRALSGVSAGVSALLDTETGERDLRGEHGVRVG